VLLYIAFLLSFFWRKRNEAKKSATFANCSAAKEALLRVLVARVILFVCAGATAPHVLAPLFVFFLGPGTLPVSPPCFFALLFILLQTVSLRTVSVYFELFLPSVSVYFELFLRTVFLPSVSVYFELFSESRASMRWL